MMLEKFLFEGSLQYQKIEKLSGGEKRRLYLCKVLMEAPNVLILDEPTNDLDISTLVILEDFLDSFNGIVIAVSHDRYFLDRVARRMLTFEENGRIELCNKSYTEYYLDKKAKEENEDSSQKEKNQTGAEAYRLQKQNTRKLKFTYAEQKEYETIEEEIEKLEEAVKNLEKELANPKYSTDFVKLNELGTLKKEKEEQLDAKMERFLYLEDLAEKIKNQ